MADGPAAAAAAAAGERQEGGDAADGRLPGYADKPQQEQQPRQEGEQQQQQQQQRAAARPGRGSQAAAPAEHRRAQFAGRRGSVVPAFSLGKSNTHTVAKDVFKWLAGGPRCY